MPRNSSGTMSLPSPGVPFQSGQVISSAQVNATFADVATEISDSASRSGKGGFTAPVRVPDGTAAAPAYAFGGEISSGWYRAGTNDIRLTVGGVDALKLVSGGLSGALTFAAGAALIQTTVASTTVQLKGNANAADPDGVDVTVLSTEDRTAGFLATFNNGTVGRKLRVDYNGLLTLGAPATAIQPAAIWTSLALNAGWTSTLGMSYLKDACGFVRLKGTATAGTGSPFTLPAGFRPLASKVFVIEDNGTGFVSVAINAAGDVTFRTSGPTASHFYIFDPVNFLAEQ